MIETKITPKVKFLSAFWALILSSLFFSILWWTEQQNRKQRDDLLYSRQQEVIKRLNDMADLLNKDREDWIKEVKKKNPQFKVPDFQTIPRLKPDMERDKD